MIKHFISFLAILIAIITFKLTTPPSITFTNYVWYSIKPTIHKTCYMDLSSITIGDLLIDNNYVSTISGFQIDTQDVTFGSDGNNLFLCDLVNEELCAVGYLKPSFGSSGFTTSNGKWVPIIDPVVRTCMTYIE